MQLSTPVARFIEDNISLIENDELPLFFYNAMFALPLDESAELRTAVFIDALNIDPTEAIEKALVWWCNDSVALEYNRRVRVTDILRQVPNFGYDSLKFRHMFYEAVKKAYPTKTISPDNYGIEYIVEKQ